MVKIICSSLAQVVPISSAFSPFNGSIMCAETSFLIQWIYQDKYSVWTKTTEVTHIQSGPMLGVEGSPNPINLGKNSRHICVYKLNTVIYFAWNS